MKGTGRRMAISGGNQTVSPLFSQVMWSVLIVP
jgi:hypothetical protein